MHTSVRLYPDKFSLRFFGMNAGLAGLLLAILLVGCTKQELPDLGPRLSQTAALELSPSLLEFKGEYTDNCGHLQIVQMGSTLQDMLFEAANRTFASVVRPGSNVKPDVVVRVTWCSRISLSAGTASTIAHKPTCSSAVSCPSWTKRAPPWVNRRCRSSRGGGSALSRFKRTATTSWMTSFRERPKSLLKKCPTHPGASSRPPARRQLRPEHAVASATAAAAPAAIPVPVPLPGRSVGAGGTALSFKATVLDDNGNLVFEGGERIRVRVDVVNTGSQELQNVTASLSGTPLVLAQFPATTLSAGRLQPGQSRSVEFVATLPQGMHPQKADLQVSVADPATAAPSAQTLSLSIQPTGLKADDVDQVPAMAVGYKQPHTYLVSIGIGSYRDQQLSVRKYAASDAELLTNYFQSLGGLPASNVRLLQDWKALRPDIDEALLDWLPGHMNKEAVVIVYFAGLATVSPNGEVFLVPYDGSMATSSRSYPLKDLEAALNRLKAKQTLFVFDGMIAKLGAGMDGRSKAVLPQWNPPGSSTVHLIATNGVGRVVEDEDHRHGLFTYYLLRALRGESDVNRDGEVTLGEAVAYLNQKVLWASKTQYGQEQRPAVVPPLKPTDPANGLALTKLAAVRASEHP